MANALVRVQDVFGTGDGATLVLQVVYMGADVGSPQYTSLEVVTAGTESAAQLRTAMSAAVAAWPSQNGYAWTVPGTNMNLPTFQKG